MTPLIRHSLETALLEAWPASEWRDLHVALAVSGGADSVALLRAAVAIKKDVGGRGRLFVAHLDHGLRGAASSDDAAWLKSLCSNLEVPLEIGRADVAAIAALQGDGTEAAARTARYDFLLQTAEKLGARFVAAAHTLDDHLETILHHILRGTGLDGLRGIPAVRALSTSVALIRPMLSLRRRDVLEYLAAIGQDYRTDASNAELRITRNRLRHELLPAIRQHYPGDIDFNLLRLSHQAFEAQELITSIALPLVDECVTVEFAADRTGAGEKQVWRVRIRCTDLARQPPLIVRTVCKIAWQRSHWPRQAMGYDQWQQLAALVEGETHMPTVNLPGNVHARRDGDVITLDRGVLP
jgi:tRNA(Ile)-lysidine synthase